MSESYAEVIVHDEKDIKGKQLAVVLTAVTAALLLFFTTAISSSSDTSRYSYSR